MDSDIVTTADGRQMRRKWTFVCIHCLRLLDENDQADVGLCGPCAAAAEVQP